MRQNVITSTFKNIFQQFLTSFNIVEFYGKTYQYVFPFEISISIIEYQETFLPENSMPVAFFDFLKDFLTDFVTHLWTDFENKQE